MSSYIENFDGRWNRALMDLHYQEARWRYFAVKNPPENKSHQWYYEPGAESQSLNKNLGEITYESVQQEINNLVDDLINHYAGQSTSIGQSKKMLQGFLEHMKEKTIKKEEQLFQQIVKNAESLRNINYLTLVNASEKYASSISKAKRQTIKMQDSIDFWTRAFYNRLNGETLISQKDAFAIIITSIDFYNHLNLRAGANDQNISSFFSRRGALRTNEQFAHLADNIGNKISKQALQILYTEYNNYVSNMFIDAGAFGITMRNQLYQVMDTVMRTYFNEYKSNTKKGKKGQINFGKIKENKKDVQASQVSKNIREKISEVLKQQKESPEVQKYLNDNPEAKFDFNIQLGSQEDNDIWFYVSADSGPVNKLYEGFASERKNLKQEEIVKFIINLIKENILSFFPKKDYLDLKSFKIDFNSIQVKGFEQNVGYEGLQRGAVEFVKSGEIYSILNSKYQRGEYWKSFAVANSNQFLSGLLGELSGMLLSINLPTEKSKMTGSLFTTISGSLKGESVNDLMINQDKYNRFGINIKHYVVSASGTLDLYKNEIDMSIYSGYINKYLGAEDLQKLRFILENEGYFENTDIITIGNRIVQRHFPEFLRIHDYNAQTRDNLFFLLNNVVYPSSYIYDCALAQLKNITKEKQFYDLFASVYTTGHNKKEMYDTVDEAYDKWTEADHELRAFKKPSGADMFIKTKGLKINLVSLSLF